MFMLYILLTCAYILNVYVTVLYVFNIVCIKIIKSYDEEVYFTFTQTSETLPHICRRVRSRFSHIRVNPGIQQDMESETMFQTK